MLQLLSSTIGDNSLKALKLGGLAMVGIFVVMLIVFISITIVNKAGNGEIKFLTKLNAKISQAFAKIKPKKKNK